MARGRRTEPAAVKIAKGNPGKRPISASSTEATDLKRIAPKELSTAARKIWDQLAPELVRLRFLKESDRAAFSRYCEYFSRWWELTAILAKEGDSYWTESLHGKMQRINPNFQIRDRLEQRLQSLEDRMGLNPAARQQIMQRLAALPAGGLFDRATTNGEGEQLSSAVAIPSPVGALPKTIVH